jgi:hypothetical protein
MWGLITGSIAGLIDGILIIVAYLLYPIVIVIFGFSTSSTAAFCISSGRS